MKYGFYTSGLTYGESESSENGECAPESTIVGRFGKLRGTGEGRALPPRLVNDGKNSDIMSLL